MGGNSTKATSGINGAGTQTQLEHGIPDSAKIFFEDTKHSVCTVADFRDYPSNLFASLRLASWLVTT